MPETEFIKEEENPTDEFILQKNKKTKIGTGIIVGVLVVLIIAVGITALFLGF